MILILTRCPILLALCQTKLNLVTDLNTLCGIIVNELGPQTFVSDFDSHPQQMRTGSELRYSGGINSVKAVWHSCGVAEIDTRLTAGDRPLRLLSGCRSRFIAGCQRRPI